MTTQSSNLQLPYLQPAQAQKHVTVNESLLRLDALVQLTVASAATSAQPADPVDGSIYVLPAGKTGVAWGSMANGALAYWRDGAWEQITPREGWLAYVKDADQLLVYDGIAWSQAGLRGALGLGTAAVKNTGAAGDVLPLLDSPATAAGAWTFTNVNSGVTVANVFPKFMLHCTAAPADARKHLFVGNNAGDLMLYALPDNEAAFPIALRITRTGATPDALIAGAKVRPHQNNVYALGEASFRWSEVFAATGTINTSDAREKTSPRPPTAAELAAIRRVLGQVGLFQWLHAVEAKGAEDARLHVGVTAQAVRDAFAAEGLDAARYGLFCADPVVEDVEVEPAQSIETEEVDPNTGATRLVRVLRPARFAQRPVLEPSTGAPRVRLGVRPDQLLWLAAAALVQDQAEA